ncbi:MAG: ATP-binding protein [Thermodesulfobacteriota bacterium]
MPFSIASSNSGRPNTGNRLRKKGTDARPWFIASVAVTVLLVGVLLWHIVYSYMLLNSFKNRELAIERSSRKLLLYAETMKSAALISATSGDLRWKKEYSHTLPELKAVLQNIPSLTRSDRVRQTTGLIRENLEEILRIESRAFDLVSQGDKKEAFRLLSGWAYTRHQLRFSRKTRELMEIIQTSIQERTSFTKTRIALFGVFCGLVFLIFSWAVTIRNWKIHVKMKQEAEEKVALLLDNSGQGFLLFDETLRVDPNYSRECLHIFGTDPSSLPLTNLLFPEGGPDADHFAKTVCNLLNETDDFKQETIISLLPDRFYINGRHLEVEYRPVPSNRMMLVITDITENVRLENQMEDEHKRLSFIVTALENKSDLLDTIDRFQDFLYKDHDPQSARGRHRSDTAGEIFRMVHTFKGLFNQFEMRNTGECLHQTESLLADLNRHRKPADREDPSGLLPVSDLLQALEADRRILRESLGEEFFSGKQTLAVSAEHFRDLMHSVQEMINSPETENRHREKLTSLLENLKRLRYVNIKTLLGRHAEYLKKNAAQTGKSIHPVEIEGPDIEVDPQKVGTFIGSLVHVFTNALVHGVETPEEREKADKDQKGWIYCQTESRQGRLLIRIGDDGRGIDRAALEKKAVEAGAISRDRIGNLTGPELVHLICSDTVTTTPKANRFSGRGIGLEAVLYETQKLNGTVEIVSRDGGGTEFIFSLPLGACVNDPGPVDGGTLPGPENADRFHRKA